MDPNDEFRFCELNDAKDDLLEKIELWFELVETMES
jgi:hypothetical protein